MLLYVGGEGYKQFKENNMKFQDWFTQEYLSCEHFRPVTRIAPISDSQSSSYNDDVHIRSVRVWGSAQRGEHGNGRRQGLRLFKLYAWDPAQ